MMEQNDQSQNLVWPGVEELIDNTGYRGVRVFNEWAYIQNRYQYCGYEGPEEITNTFFRAIAERNCKIIFLKMILEPDNDVSWDADEKEWTYVTDPADYEKIAAVGLCRVLLEKRRSEPQIKFGKLLGFTLGTAIATILTAFCGSLLASSALSQLSYILEIDLYRGVKLMQLIPIALFMLAYLLVYAYEETGAREAVLAHAGQRGEKNRVKRFNAYFGELMQTPMKLGWFLAIVVIAVAAVFMLLVFAYYMYRTGNSTTTSARELAFRNFLENTLIARPRTKEMIVGWPMLMLFIWSLRRRMRFLPMIFGMGMTIGLVSVVNTFLHIRTPFLLSLLRTGWGILFGLLIGTAVVIVAELIYRLVRRICGVTNG